jgi:hypothetical protein
MANSNVMAPMATANMVALSMNESPFLYKRTTSHYFIVDRENQPVGGKSAVMRGSGVGDLVTVDDNHGYSAG